MPLAPGALLDRIVINHRGEFTARATFVLGGMAMEYSAEGTFDVAEDCTAEASYTYRINGGDPLGPAQSRCLVLDGGRRMECMPLGGVWMGAVQKLSPGSCSERVMKGTYAATCRDSWLPLGPEENPLVPSAAMAVFSLDHNGLYTATGTAVAGGLLVAADYTGSMTVNPDCTIAVEHAVRTNLGVEYTETGKGIIVQPGWEFYTISTKGDQTGLSPASSSGSGNS
jgi:hypothetical protein